MGSRIYRWIGIMCIRATYLMKKKKKATGNYLEIIAVGVGL